MATYQAPPGCPHRHPGRIPARPDGRRTRFFCLYPLRDHGLYLAAVKALSRDIPADNYNAACGKIIADMKNARAASGARRPVQRRDAYEPRLTLGNIAAGASGRRD